MLSALEPLGYSEPTPIQSESIPLVIDGKDLLGCAQTGTGKTAAFSLPVIHTLFTNPAQQGSKRYPRALILTPTRELATQIGVNLTDYNKHTRLFSTTIYGGVSQHKQVDALRRGVDIVVATPGRLLDLVNQRHLDLRFIEVLVLDEADTMLDMGFIPDIRRIIALIPEKRQTLFFSATMPQNIVKLASDILKDPVRVEVARVSSAAETVEQHIYSVRQNDKRALLVDVLKRPEVETALVFTRTKYGADKVAKHLGQAGIQSEAIHGNKSQPQRTRAMNGFKKGKIKVLVATDIASRGIDVDELSHVINFELPNIPESYIHRIGRTGRAGASGCAISFCNENEERNYLRDIQRLLEKEIPIQDEHQWHLDMPPVGTESTRGKSSSSRNKPANRRNGGSGRSGRSTGSGGANFGRKSFDRSGSDSRSPKKKQYDKPRSGSGGASRYSKSNSGSGGASRYSKSNSGSDGDSRYSKSNSGSSYNDRRPQRDDRPGRRNDSRPSGPSQGGGDNRPQRDERRPFSGNRAGARDGQNNRSRKPQSKKPVFKPSEPTKPKRTFGGFFGFDQKD